MNATVLKIKRIIIMKMSAVSSMSKRRYQKIVDKLTELITDEEKLNEALTSIREIMRFDPTKVQYTPEKGEKVRERRKEQMEKTGQSLYVISGAKRAYEKKRAAKIAETI
jgi:hypothetical protein